jgi:hypothetical protein
VHRDRIERRTVGDALAAVGGDDLGPGDAELGERRPRPCRQRLDPLDPDNFVRELGEDRHRVARAAADVEHPFAARQRQRLRDRGDDPRLGDRLTVPDG